MITDLLAYKIATKGLFIVHHAFHKDGLNLFKEKEIPAVNIPFNKPYLTGWEQAYINQVLYNGNGTTGNYATKCLEYFKMVYSVKNCRLTSSYAHASEIAAKLLDIQDGDEVIIPSFAPFETVAALIEKGANLIFADSRKDHPGMDEQQIEVLVTPKTKAIMVFHYAGIAADMDIIMDIADRNNLLVVEDASQCIDAYYKNRALGTIGHLGIMSFDDSKNIICGSAGLLMINDDHLAERAEQFKKKSGKETPAHNEMTAAFLYAQLQQLQKIQKSRLDTWNRYYEELKELEVLGFAKMPVVPEYAIHNAHMFYITLPDHTVQEKLKAYLKQMGISATNHYTAIHSSDAFSDSLGGRVLPNCITYNQCLLRLPLYTGMTIAEQKTVINKIWRFFLQK